MLYFECPWCCQFVSGCIHLQATLQIRHDHLCQHLVQCLKDCFDNTDNPCCFTYVHNMSRLQVPIEGGGVTRAVMSSNVKQQHTCPQIPATNGTVEAACEDKRLTWMTAQCYYSLHLQCCLLGVFMSCMSATQYIHNTLSHNRLPTGHQVRSLRPLMKAEGQ